MVPRFPGSSLRLSDLSDICFRESEQMHLESVKRTLYWIQKSEIAIATSSPFLARFDDPNIGHADRGRISVVSRLVEGIIERYDVMKVSGERC